MRNDDDASIAAYSASDKDAVKRVPFHSLPEHWKNYWRAISMAAINAEKSANTLRNTLIQESDDADELLILLRLDPLIYRTDSGAINIAKVRAALANPEEYPMLPPSA